MTHYTVIYSNGYVDRYKGDDLYSVDYRNNMITFTLVKSLTNAPSRVVIPFANIRKIVERDDEQD